MCGMISPELRAVLDRQNAERVQHIMQAEFAAQQAQLNAFDAKQQRRHQDALNSFRARVCDIDREQAERRAIPDARKDSDGSWEL